MTRINVANPSEKSWASQSYLLSFGAYGDTYVLAYGHLEDALESAAEWLAENAPGHFISNEEMNEAYADACAKYGVEWPVPEYYSEGVYDKAMQYAEQDLTYTESGYLRSWGWGIALENPSKQQLIEFYKR